MHQLFCATKYLHSANVIHRCAMKFFLIQYNLKFCFYYLYYWNYVCIFCFSAGITSQAMFFLTLTVT